MTDVTKLWKQGRVRSGPRRVEAQPDGVTATMRPGRRKTDARRANPLVSCHLAREAISALVDGEEPPISDAITSSHVAQCDGCQEFRARVASLTREMRVRAFDPEPDGSQAVLELLGYRDRGVVPRHRRTRTLQSRVSLARASQWAAGVVPLGVACLLYTSPVTDQFGPKS